MANANSQHRPQKPRKPSWEYQTLASLVSFPKRHFAAKSILTFLGSKADDHGISRYGYEAIKAHTNFTTNQSISNALKYIRDFSKAVVGTPILTWEHGRGGESKKQTNRYKLHLGALKEMVAKQGTFTETGKRTKYAQSSVTNEHDSTTQSSMTNTSEEPQSSMMNAPVEYVDPYTNHHITTSKIKINQDARDSSISSDSPKLAPDAASEPTTNINDNDVDSAENTRPPAPLRKVDRCCPECNAKRVKPGVRCSFCPFDASDPNYGEWRDHPRSEAEGKWMMEVILAIYNDEERRETYFAANPAQRHWISAGRYAAEQAKVLDEIGEKQ